MSEDNLHTEDIELQQYLMKFMKAVRISCINAAAIPCAYAIMFAEPGPRGTTIFKVDVDAIKQLLPKGADEVQLFLCQCLDKWARINYPEEVDTACDIGEPSKLIH